MLKIRVLFSEGPYQYHEIVCAAYETDGVNLKCRKENGVMIAFFRVSEIKGFYLISDDETFGSVPVPVRYCPSCGAEVEVR